MRLILSPHLDDALLSLGGFLYETQDIPTKVISIFNTGWTCLELPITPENLTKLNLEEHKIVMDELNCINDYWDYPEALLRDYKKWNAKLNVRRDRLLYETLKKRIYDCISEGEYSQIFCPMSIENHVDHELIFQIINDLLIENWVVWNKIDFFLYEDLPYAYYINMRDELKRVNKYYQLADYIQNIDKFVEKKKSLLLEYKSQVTPEDIHKTIEYSKKIYTQGSAERFWKIEKLNNFN